MVDHDAADVLAERVLLDEAEPCELDFAELQNLAESHEATRSREKRLEALVRKHAKCGECEGKGRIRWLVDQDEYETGPCKDCAGTGLVEAARKELSRD